MTLLQHQRLAGIGLSVFSLVEFAVLANAGIEAKTLYAQTAGTDTTLHVLLLSSFIFGFTLGFTLVLIQLIGGLRLIFTKRPVSGWSVAASIIAILTIWGLPVGIYGIWTQQALNKSKES